MSKVIAIDGPAGSGKSSLGNNLAKALDYNFLTTGFMYRLAGWLYSQNSGGIQALIKDLKKLSYNQGNFIYDNKSIKSETLDALYTDSVASVASYVSSLAEIREILNDQQKEIIKKERFVVEGRDIGSEIAPDAALKILLYASPETRAKRRSKQAGIPYQEALKAIKERDAYDSRRKLAPLVLDKDEAEKRGQIFVDSTQLSYDSTLNLLIRLAHEKGL